MENKSYSYGMKITGVLLHSFFTVIMTVSIFLLVALIDKNILQLADIGTEEFLNSGYYLSCMEQKCSDLSEYMLLTQRGEFRSSEEEKRYLRYNSFSRKTPTFVTGTRQEASGIPTSRTPRRDRSLTRRRS